MKRGLLFSLLVVVLLVALDQWSKGAVTAWLRPPPPGLDIDEHGHHRYLILGEWLAFNWTSNKGAAFGKFDQWPHVLVGGRILAVCLLSWLLVKAQAGQAAQRGQVWIHVAMTLVLAGAIGNLIDNLWTGAPEPDHPYFGVRDFIDVWFKPLGWDYHFPSFNVADACISVGAVIWIVSGLFQPKEEESEPDGAEAPAATP